MKKIFLGFGLVLLVLTVFVTYASADQISLSTPNAALSSYTNTPYAIVTVTLGSGGSSADVTFTGQTYGSGTTGTTYLLGGNGAADLNVNGGFSVSNLTGTEALSGFSGGALSTDLNKSADGFGNFGLTIDAFDGYTSAYQSISFTLNKTSGTWSSAADVLTNNTTGYSAAAHIFVGNGVPPDASAGAAVTGYAANGTPSVPEPSTLLLMGIGLMGLGIFGYRRKNA